MSTATATATGRLLNPATYDAAEFDAATQRLFRATIDWFEAKGKAAAHRRDAHRRLVRGLHRVPRARARVRDAAHAGARRRRRPRQALGHARATRVFNEILGFYGLPYWYAWQVTILGLGPIWQSDNDAARRRAAAAARGRRGVRLRPLRARPRRRHLLDRHDPHARRRGRLPRQRRQVLHRQRQRGRDGLGVRPARRRRGARGLRLLRRRQPAPRLQAASRTSSTRRCTSAPSTSRTTRSRAEDVLHTGAEAFEAALNTINVGKFNLGFCAIGHGRALLLRDGHPGREPGPVRQARDRVRPGPADPLRGLRAAARGQALRRARGRLRAQRQPRGPPLPALHADQQDAGDDGGRADRAPAGRGDLGQGLRARLATSTARRTSSTGCPSSRARSTSTAR